MSGAAVDSRRSSSDGSVCAFAARLRETLLEALGGGVASLDSLASVASAGAPATSSASNAARSSISSGV